MTDREPELVQEIRLCDGGRLVLRGKAGEPDGMHRLERRRADGSTAWAFELGDADDVVVAMRVEGGDVLLNSWRGHLYRLTLLSGDCTAKDFVK